MHQPSTLSALLSVAIVTLAAGCGGSSTSGRPFTPAPPAQTTRVELLASSTQGFDSLAYRDGKAYLAQSNTPTQASAVLTAALPLVAGARWNPLALGSCGLSKARDDEPARAPNLRLLGSTLWLFQPWYDSPAAAAEPALCALDAGASSFAVRDAGLKACSGGYCSTLWMSDLKQPANVLYSNAGAGANLLASNDRGASWRVLLGQFDAMMCTHQAFHVLGDRVLVGGECPLDMAYLRAYPLRADGMALASSTPLAISVPNLENRNVQFIDAVPNTQRVFAGVEGGLLRSEDGGRSFKFVIEQPVEGNKSYPYIRAFLALRTQPDTVVVGGFDKATGKPYLAWSADGGAKWSDISSLLPGHARTAGDASPAEVTSISEDPQGRIVITVNEHAGSDGRLLLLTLARSWNLSQ
jgi:hypothetical protein